MDNNRITYRILEIPDPQDPRYQAAAPNGVFRSISDGFNHVLRHFSNMRAGSMAATIIWIYDPKCTGPDRRSRLRLYLQLESPDESRIASLSQFVERGELSRFYRFDQSGDLGKLQEPLPVNCDITRREHFIQPGLSRKHNANIPSRYYVISPFRPAEYNDLFPVDRVLDNVDEPVVISVRVEPTSVAKESCAMTAVMERLYSINHQWNCESDNVAEMDFLAESQGYFRRHNRLRSLHRSDHLADEVLRDMRQISQSLCTKPHLHFAIQVFAKTEPVARLVGSVLAESAFEDGLYRLNVVDGGETCGLQDQDLQSSTVCPPDAAGDERLPEYANLARLPRLATVEELASIWRLPIGSGSGPLCLRRNTDPPYENSDDMIVLGFDEQGIQGNPKPLMVGLSLQALCKHGCAFGTSGSGKTTFGLNLLYQLYAKGIPFLVVETVKKEYRIIKMFKGHPNKRYSALAHDLEVYTVACETCSPLRLNPLELLDGVCEDSHIESLTDCCGASMANFPALMPILTEAFERVYEKHPDRGHPPTLAEVLPVAREVLAEKGYGPEVAANLGAALDVRHRPLTRGSRGSVFKCRHSIPSVAHMMSGSTVIELDQVSSPDHKCLITLFMLMLLREHLQSLPPAKGLRFVIVIEETHNILGPAGDARPSEDAPDPKAYVVDFIRRMLVELRALGVGVVLNEQHPSSVDPAAVKSTGFKLAFRQIYGMDRKELAASMLLTDMQAEDLARLGPGEAYFFKEGYFRPLRIRTVNLHTELDLARPPTDLELLKEIREEAWFQSMARMRAAVELDQLRDALDELDRCRIRIMRGVRQLQDCCEGVLSHFQKENSPKRLTSIVHDALELKKRLILSFDAFVRGPFKAYAASVETPYLFDADLQTVASQLNERSKCIRTEGRDSLLSVIERLIQSCRDLAAKGVKP